MTQINLTDLEITALIQAADYVSSLRATNIFEALFLKHLADKLTKKLTSQDCWQYYDDLVKNEIVRRQNERPRLTLEN